MPPPTSDPTAARPHVIPAALSPATLPDAAIPPTALRIPTDPGVLAVADGVIRYGDGPLAFVPDFLLGNDPEAVKKDLKAAYARLLDLEFDHVLFAHGNAWIGGAKKALHAFVGAV
jgi:hypothetical protein